ncbi:hypothetical protein ElyMa_000744800 [Elysia marginata]|uniref:Uncharacterized protein n=1 Tax=Elysia marginata TaxID=1093978 RepID=A0AAV4GQ07_9GAST|nr:hypothetical protein ElyMa_000744800 [Elysia marginata]
MSKLKILNVAAIFKTECERDYLDKISQSKGKVFQHGNKKVIDIGGAGKLTKSAVKRVQGHYGGAIRKNEGYPDKMKAAVGATWHHRNGDNRNVMNLVSVMNLIRISCPVL